MATATVFDIIKTSKSAYNGPDQKLVQDQLLGLQMLLDSYGEELFAAQMLWILRRNPEKGERDILPTTGMWNRRLVPFIHNKIQCDLNSKLGLRNILLKPRQAGYTTYFILMRLMLRCILSPGAGGLLISQNHHYAALHFAILMRGHRYFGINNPYDRRENKLADELHQHLLHTATSNRREMVLDALESRIVVESAEVPEAGQGLSINYAVATEVARWPGNPEETLANMKEAIPQEGTLDMESTADGFGGYFHEEFLRAWDKKDGEETEFKAHFHEWWWHDEYRRSPAVKKDSLTEEEQNLVNKFHLDLEQIRWRRWKKITLRHNFEEKYPEDPMTAFLLAGNRYFDKEILRARYLELINENPLEEFKKVKIWRKPNPKKRYIVGADVATGKNAIVVKGGGANEQPEDLDASTAVVYELESGEECASYHARLSPEEFAWDINELARLYNDAIVAVERNGDGGTVLLTLEVMCMYGNIYKHKEWYRRGSKRQIIEWPGFPTSTRTRPIALNRLRNMVQSAPELFHDVKFIEEALNFVRNEKGIPAAAPGGHDDRVMCRAVGAYARAVVLGDVDALATPSESYRDEEEVDESESE